MLAQRTITFPAGRRAGLVSLAGQSARRNAVSYQAATVAKSNSILSVLTASLGHRLRSWKVMFMIYLATQWLSEEHCVNPGSHSVLDKAALCRRHTHVEVGNARGVLWDAADAKSTETDGPRRHLL